MNLQENISMLKPINTTRHKPIRIMSFGVVLAAIFLFCAPPAAGASDIELGLHFGYRQLKDAKLKDIYGSDMVFRPQVRYFFSRNFGLEVAYEGGYKKDGSVGLYNENSTLTMNAVEAAFVLRMEKSGWVPFIKGGMGFYGYKQDIDSNFTRRTVDHHTTAPFFGAGLDVALISGLFLSGTVHYVLLKVKPFDIEVDLGGLRILLGLRFRLPSSIINSTSH
jgi:hypothetical protein